MARTTKVKVSELKRLVVRWIAGRSGESDTRGVALLMALLIVALLSVLVLEFSYKSRLEASLTFNDFFDLEAEYAARAGLAYSMALLKEDMLADQDKAQKDTPKTDALTESWAEPVVRQPITDDASFTVSASDEGGKLDLNSLRHAAILDLGTIRVQFMDVSGKEGGQGREISQDDKEAMRRIVDLLAALPIVAQETELTADELAAGIMDWIDPDSETREEGGAESDYYEQLNPPYKCKNGPFVSVDELVLVRGFTQRMLYGDGETPGLVKYLTANGNPKNALNVNTAMPELITIWNKKAQNQTDQPQTPSTTNNQDEDIGAELVAEREKNGPFNNMSDLRSRVSSLKNPRGFTFHSDRFLVVSEGVARSSRVQIRALLERRPPTQAVVESGLKTATSGAKDDPEGVRFYTIDWRILR